MANGLEIELKLAASPAMLEGLREHPLLLGEERSLTLVTRYFDTAEAALHGGKASLRLREGDSAREQTFKFAGKGALHRGEWNAPATGSVPDPAAFGTGARRLLGEIAGSAPLQEMATTRVERRVREVTFAASRIEAAFDRGEVTAGPRQAELCELELELRDGRAADLFALALELPLGPELMWAVESKGERGTALAFDLPAAAVRAAELSLSPEMDVAGGFQAIAWNCLSQLLGNYRQVIADGAPDAVHQSRVAIRRLRAAFSLFANALAHERLAVFRAEWKAAASALGPARDLHVLIERAEAAARDSGSDAEAMLNRLREERAAATGQAQSLLSGKAFQHLLLSFALWLEQGEWCAPGAARPLADFAAKELSRRRRKLVAVDPLETLSDDALHALRIKGKKLRYAAEFFGALFPDAAKERREFAKAMGKLQDCLGSVHDAAVAQAQREALFADVEPIAAAGFTAQLAELEGHAPGRKRLIRSAARALAAVAAAPAWWKHSAVPAAAD
jgi:inorganic triphosphatase YgiF